MAANKIITRMRTDIGDTAFALGFARCGDVSGLMNLLR